MDSPEPSSALLILPAGNLAGAAEDGSVSRRGAWFFANGAINRLAIHSTLHTLAWTVSGAFWTAFLLRAGLKPSIIFLAVAGVLVLRFAFRPLVLLSLGRWGPRASLIIGVVLFAAQYPSLAFVTGPGWALVVFCVVTALGAVFYWTCYHAFFAALGDAANRGSQLGARQIWVSFAAVLGPAAGGIMLATLGPWAAFGTSVVLELGAALPLIGLPEPAFLRIAPRDAYSAARVGALLLATDGWIINCSNVAWDIIAFRALATRYDSFGWLLAAAALVGAFGGLFWGRLIDSGYAHRAVGINALAWFATLALKALAIPEPLFVVAATIFAALLGGLYIPALMTAVYNEAKSSPCPLRFQFAAEGAWDVAGTVACLVAATLCALDVPLQGMIALALPGVAVQALLLKRYYAGHARALAAA